MIMEETKRCPYCGEEILAVAKKCKHCGEWLETKEPEKAKKICPICGELIDKEAEKCPYCKEPVIEKTDSEISSESIIQETPIDNNENMVKTTLGDSYKNDIQSAFWAVMLGGVLTFINFIADIFSSETGGLVGVLIWLDNLIPSWFEPLLDGMGSAYLLWCVAKSIKLQKKAAQIDDNGAFLFLNILSILYLTFNLIKCFDEEGQLRTILLVLLILIAVIQFITGLILNTEKNTRLVFIGKAFLLNVLIMVFTIRTIYKEGYDPMTLQIEFLFDEIIWISAMITAYIYIKSNKND